MAHLCDASLFPVLKNYLVMLFQDPLLDDGNGVFYVVKHIFRVLSNRGTESPHEDLVSLHPLLLNLKWREVPS